MSVGTAIINETEEKYKDGNEAPAPRHGVVFSGTYDKVRNGPQYAGGRDRAYQVKGTFTGSGPERERAMEDRKIIELSGCGSKRRPDVFHQAVGGAADEGSGRQRRRLELCQM